MIVFDERSVHLLLLINCSDTKKTMQYKNSYRKNNSGSIMVVIQKLKIGHGELRRNSDVFCFRNNIPCVQLLDIVIKNVIFFYRHGET